MTLQWHLVAKNFDDLHLRGVPIAHGKKRNVGVRENNKGLKSLLTDITPK